MTLFIATFHHPALFCICFWRDERQLKTALPMARQERRLWNAAEAFGAAGKLNGWQPKPDTLARESRTNRRGNLASALFYSCSIASRRSGTARTHSHKHTCADFLTQVSLHCVWFALVLLLAFVNRANWLCMSESEWKAVPIAAPPSPPVPPYRPSLVAALWPALL